MTDVILSEMFGPTIQGEGPRAGRRAHFIRLSRCNLTCTYCDTPYTWDWSRYVPANEQTRAPVASIIDRIGTDALSCDLVITGGEPLLQRTAVTELIDGFTEAGARYISFETNGTVRPPDNAELAHFVVSPKLPASGVLRAQAWVPDVLRTFNALDADLKFVPQNEFDMDRIREMVAEAEWPADRVWLMPEGTSAAAMATKSGYVAEWAIAEGYNFSSRLHVLAWGNERMR